MNDNKRKPSLITLIESTDIGNRELAYEFLKGMIKNGCRDALDELCSYIKDPIDNHSIYKNWKNFYDFYFKEFITMVKGQCN